MKREEKKAKKRMPFWMIVIFIFLIFAALSFILNLLRPVFIFGVLLSGVFALIFNVILFIIVVFLIIGILKKDIRAWKLALIYFGYGMLNTLISMIVIIINPKKIINKLNPGIELGELTGILLQNTRIIMGIMMVLIFIFYLFIFYYFYKHKDFFSKKVKKK
jgi:hypothetical protein